MTFIQAVENAIELLERISKRVYAPSDYLKLLDALRLARETFHASQPEDALRRQEIRALSALVRGQKHR